MAGRIIHTPERPHVCTGSPEPEPLRPGTIWRCDNCSTKWVVVYGQGEDGKGYSAWRELNGRNARGEDLF